mgnify:CR=1 FL=1
MKRMHLHISVDDLNKSILFYNAVFGMKPTVQKTDYAKWMLDDPLVNFAISNRGAKIGLDHISKLWVLYKDSLQADLTL